MKDENTVITSRPVRCIKTGAKREDADYTHQLKNVDIFECPECFRKITYTYE